MHDDDDLPPENPEWLDHRLAMMTMAGPLLDRLLDRFAADEVAAFLRFAAGEVEETLGSDRAWRAFLKELSTRAQNCLCNNRVASFEALTALTAAELTRWWNLGAKSLADIESALAARGMSLRQG